MSTESTTETPTAGDGLRWWQGLDRYCWIVLIVAALGWLFDTMDQNIFNLVRTPSVRELLVHQYGKDQQTTSQAKALLGVAGKVVLVSTSASSGGPEYMVSATDRNGLTVTFPAAPLSDEIVGQRNTAASNIAPDSRVSIVGYEPSGGHYLIEDQKSFEGKVSKAGGDITAIFLLGWSAGGFLFGILGDRIGRTGTMIITILIYAVFTGLSGLVQTLPLYGAVRFMTALGVGGEWAAGAALVAEVFPARSRPMALGTLQALSAVGNMMAAVITLSLAGLSWRWAYFIGAAPALLVLWIRRSVKEPEKWKHAKEEAAVGKELGNISELFTSRVLRNHTIAAVLMATAGVGALWGVGFFSTDLVRDELTKAGLAAKLIDQRVSIMFLLQNLGAFFGIYLFAAFSERFNRRTAFFFWFAFAWASVLMFFWAVTGSRGNAFVLAAFLAPVLGFATLGPFSGYTVYFPELFPTRLRTTGCGFCYNAARILAAAAPYAMGSFKAAGEYAIAATLVSSVYILGFIGAAIAPETKGKPLPE